MHILLIEDEKNIHSFIKKGLEREGFFVTPAYDGETGLLLLGKHKFDLVILDIVLPGRNGWEVCRAIRSELNCRIPVLMLSALNATDEIIRGLDTGADDYMGKPFKFAELLARLKALQRRYTGQLEESKKLIYADLQMNLDTREVWRSDLKITLTAKEFNLLKFFLSHPEKVLSRNQILEKVWGVDFEIGTNVVDVYVNYLRKKIERNDLSRLIHTKFGMGYTLHRHDT